MKMRTKTPAQLQEQHWWTSFTAKSIQNYIEDHDGVIYVINSKYQFLGFRDRAWDLDNKADIEDLIDDLYVTGIHIPSKARRSDVVFWIQQHPGKKGVLPVITLDAPFARQPGQKLIDYREDLRQHILNTYYPIN